MDILIVRDGGRDRRIADADLPFPVGISREGTVLFGESAEAPALWLGQAEGRLFAQPDGNIRGVLHNGAPVLEAVWLDPGDRLRLGGSEYLVSSDDGILRLAPADTGLDGKPVSEPAPASGGAPPAMTPPPRAKPSRPHRRTGRRMRIAVGAVLAVLALGAGLVLAVSAVRIATEPPAERVSLSGLPPAVWMFGRYLALPGTYRMRAEKAGYRRLEEVVKVSFGTGLDLRYRLRELPGYLSLSADMLPAPMVSMDGKELGSTPLSDIELDAGAHEIRAEAPRYRPLVRTIEIEGKGARQSVDLQLEPAWGTLVVETDPPGAQVSVGRTMIGTTPLQAEPIEGRYRLDISRDKWKPVARDVFVIAGQTVRLPPIKLEKSDGILVLTSSPPAATVTIDGEFRGRTPLRAGIAADRDHAVVVSKAGYGSETRTISAGAAETRLLEISLSAQLGTVFIKTVPPDAELVVDGKAMGRASRRLRLASRPHSIEISRAGYVTHKATVTPKPDVATRLDVTLKKPEDVAREKIGKGATTGAGQKLIAVMFDRPVSFEMGASRSEAGRRSNEARYTVELTRAFLIGEREVTNAEFRAFRTDHKTAGERSTSLDAPDMPVASVGWDDAARYLNWLSARDGLPPAYSERGGKMEAVRPMTTGYRLPTEAEWAFAARFEAGRRSLSDPLKYPWGDAMPPTGRAGNFADSTARRALQVTLPDYTDSFAFAAPVAQFAPNRAGLYDLGGNVSEWCHDIYDIPAVSTGVSLRDPMGPERGSRHVVRGSSWRHGSVTELRLAWRDFADAPRNDLGFRIARYVN